MNRLTLNTKNYLVLLQENLGTGSKIGLGAGVAGGLAAGTLGIMGHDLSQAHDDFAEKFGEISKSPTLEIQAGGIDSLQNGSTSIKDILLDKTNVNNGTSSISLRDAQEQYINDEKLKAIKNMSPGIIGGSAALGAIGAGIGASNSNKR